MRSKAETIPAGAIFTVTSGCYSDYYVRGVFRAKQPIDAEKLRDEWVIKHPEQANNYQFDESAFLASLAPMIETIDCWELHLGNYSRASELNVDKIQNEAA